MRQHEQQCNSRLAVAVTADRVGACHMWLLQQLVPASASANRCHHRLTDRVAHATCGRQALTALHSTLCRGQTFWNCNFRLDFKVASAPYFACSSAAPLPCTSLHSHSPALCARATPTEHKCNLLRWAVAGCTSRSQLGEC